MFFQLIGVITFVVKLTNNTILKTILMTFYKKCTAVKKELFCSYNIKFDV